MTEAHPDLFGTPELAAPARYVPKPEHVMSGVRAILDPMTAAQDGWPFSITETQRIREGRWAYYMRLLPPAEAARWRAVFDREAARLDAASERLAA